MTDAKLKKVLSETLNGSEKQYAGLYEKCIPKIWAGIREEDMESIYMRVLGEEKAREEISGVELPGEKLTL